MGIGQDLEVTLPDGRRVHLWQGGATQGPTVVFLHGCPDTRRAAFPGRAAAESAGVRLLAVNRPGYGRSDPAASGHGSFADDLIAVADLLGVGRFAVLGMSLGGPYALACAARHPHRVTAAGVVAAPAMSLGPPWHRDDLTPEQQTFFARLVSCSVEEAMELMRPEFEDFVATVSPQDPDEVAVAERWNRGLHPLDLAVLSELPSTEIAASAREALMSSDGYLRDAAVTFRRWDFRPEDVSCPTWLWYGAYDANAPARNGRWFADRVPGASLVVRQDTAHLGSLHRYWDDMLATLRDAS
jgi:pimeloyl-ACP methyl ester carboxylesterase